MTYNLSQLTSVLHPILVHRADEMIKFCIDKGCLEIQEDKNEWLWSVVITNTNEMHPDESCRRNTTRVINVYRILFSKDKDRLGDKDVNGKIIIKWVVDKQGMRACS